MIALHDSSRLNPRRRLVRRALWPILASLCLTLGILHRTGTSDEATMASQFNVPLPTLGGKQLWTDHVIRSGHRIQQNALTGHWRWLDPNNIRRAWGSRTDVDQALNRAVPQAPAAAAAPATHVIVLLHGLMRTDHSMESLQSALEARTDGEVIRFGYASTRETLADSAVALRDVLNDFPATTRFSFVGHSMGNIVTRRCIGDLQRDGDGLLARCDAMVMMGPPNQGAAIARQMSKTGVFGWVAGPAAMQLGPEWDSVAATLATPPFPFAIVAGNRLDSAIQNPLVDGPSDFVVSVDEARLDGAAELHEVPMLHSFLMDDPGLQAWTSDWLIRHGSGSLGPRPADSIGD